MSLLLVILDQLLDRLGHRLAHRAADLLDDLPLGRLVAEDEAGDGDGDNDQRGDRKDAVVGERGAQPGGLVLAPFVEGRLEQVPGGFRVHGCISQRRVSPPVPMQLTYPPASRPQGGAAGRARSRARRSTGRTSSAATHQMIRRSAALTMVVTP